MINKVVFFRYLPLTKKVFGDFYMQELQNAGFDVEYWYLPFVINIPKQVEIFEHRYVKVIHSYKALNERLKHEDKEHTIFISIQTYTGNVLWLYWIMSKNNCRLSVFGKNMIPVSSIPIEKKYKSLSLSSVFYAISNRLAYYFKKIGIIKSYEILFLSAESGINAYGYSTKRERFYSKHILVNSDDYDRALSVKEGERICDEEYIVFIDECLPLHPDIQICGIKAMNADIYYRDLNAFFDRIEEEFGLRVIIAAHPKALIYKEKDFFNGRKIMFGKTLELIRDSRFVLFHDSTSVGYAVFYNKPVISLVSNSIKDGQNTTYYSILEFSKQLNSHLIFIDDYIKNNDCILLDKISIDKDAYNRYKYRYLTNPETENILSVDLVIKGLKGL